MNSFREVIDAFGVAELAALFGVAESHVRTMKARDSVPPEFWGLMIERAPAMIRRELTYEGLRALRSSRFTKQPSTERAAS